MDHKTPMTMKNDDSVDVFDNSLQNEHPTLAGRMMQASFVNAWGEANYLLYLTYRWFLQTRESMKVDVSKKHPNSEECKLFAADCKQYDFARSHVHTTLKLAQKSGSTDSTVIFGEFAMEATSIATNTTCSPFEGILTNYKANNYSRCLAHYQRLERSLAESASQLFARLTIDRTISLACTASSK